jgi:uncharacterized membrane protein YfhO
MIVGVCLLCILLISTDVEGKQRTHERIVLMLREFIQNYFFVFVNILFLLVFLLTNTVFNKRVTRQLIIIRLIFLIVKNEEWR